MTKLTIGVDVQVLMNVSFPASRVYLHSADEMTNSFFLTLRSSARRATFA